MLRPTLVRQFCIFPHFFSHWTGSWNSWELINKVSTLSQLYAFTFLETNSSMVGQFWVCDMVWYMGNHKVCIVTIGTWYKALWSPNLIQNHNKKVFHTSFEIHLFLGNVPPLQCITELPDDSNSQKKPKIIFSGHKLIKMYNCTRKWWNPNISPCLSNFPTQELISHT